jgi:AraC-like DNA-binding protein
VIYLEHPPAAPLSQSIHALWYAQAPRVLGLRERILPSGCVQIILNLARDFLLDCPETQTARPVAPALVVGARSVYEIVDTSDMADLIGISFRPGAFAPFAMDAADLFSNRSVALDDVWGASAIALRDRLRELPTPDSRLRLLEAWLQQKFPSRLLAQAPVRPGLVEFALAQFNRTPAVASVRQVARSAGLSERRFSQLFREQVGFPPKVWTRIRRFQRAVNQLHAGTDMRWTDLALDCGFYDQSHFANEFRAFSGIDVSTYSARQTRWANHVAAD